MAILLIVILQVRLLLIDVEETVACVRFRILLVFERSRGYL